MRILHVYKDYAPVLGGIENHIAMLARGTGRRRPRGDGAGDGAGSERQRIHGGRRAGRTRPPAWPTWPRRPSARALARRLARERPHVTHLHCPTPWPRPRGWRWVARPWWSPTRATSCASALLGALWAPWPAPSAGAGRTGCWPRVRLMSSRRPSARGSRPGDGRAVGHRSGALRRHRSARGPRSLRRHADAGLRRTVALLQGPDVLLDALARLPGVQLLVAGTGPRPSRWRRRPPPRRRRPDALARRRA